MELRLPLHVGDWVDFLVHPHDNMDCDGVYIVDSQIPGRTPARPRPGRRGASCEGAAGRVDALGAAQQASFEGCEWEPASGSQPLGVNSASHSTSNPAMPNFTMIICFVARPVPWLVPRNGRPLGGSLHVDGRPRLLLFEAGQHRTNETGF